MSVVLKKKKKIQLTLDFELKLVFGIQLNLYSLNINQGTDISL